MLPTEVVELFHEIRQGEQFPFAWLATTDPDGGARVRTIKMAGFNLQKGVLYLCCNRQHAKAAHLVDDPRAEICLVDLGGPCQLRFRCQMRFLGSAESPMVRRFWSRMSEETRRKSWGCSANRVDPPVNFLAVEGRIQAVDLLDLRPDTPVRRQYTLREGQFLGESLAL